LRRKGVLSHQKNACPRRKGKGSDRGKSIPETEGRHRLERKGNLFPKFRKKRKKKKGGQGKCGKKGEKLFIGEKLESRWEKKEKEKRDAWALKVEEGKPSQTWKNPSCGSEPPRTGGKETGASVKKKNLDKGGGYRRRNFSLKKEVASGKKRGRKQPKIAAEEKSLQPKKKRKTKHKRGTPGRSLSTSRKG